MKVGGLVIPDYSKEMEKGILKLGQVYGVHTVFEDFLSMLGYEISNSVDMVHKEKRTEEYMKIVSKYKKEDMQIFAEISCNLLLALEKYRYEKDILGELFHRLNLHSHYKGQYFTPINISKMMAQIVTGEQDKFIEEKGYFTMQEPTCGSGAMVIAVAGALEKCKYNPSFNFTAFAVDIDFKCVMMAYIQLSLLGIPAVVVHGDSIVAKEYQRFYTPIYVLHGWVFREPLGFTTATREADELLKLSLDPLYTKIRYAMKLLKSEPSDSKESEENGKD